MAHEIRGVEIFAAGVHKGDKYEIRDLDDIVAAFGEAGFRVPVKLGHTDDPGAPAVGWVANLRRVGSKLLADLTDLDAETVAAIRRRRFGPVSSEILWNAERDGRRFRRMLGGVALLGAAVPAVPSLRPAWENLVAEAHLWVEAADRIRLYEYEPTGGRNMATEGKVVRFAGIDHKVVGEELLACMQQVADERGFSLDTAEGWARAYRIVQHEEPELVRRYVLGEEA